jgi:hypothetical protein
MSVSKARAATIDERRARLIRMRVARVPYPEIVTELGYNSEATARKDFTAEDRRYIEGLGYDLLEAAFMPKALTGDQPAAELVRKIKADRIKLFGLAAPLQIDATITEVTQQDVAIRQLISEAEAKNADRLAAIRERHELAKVDRGGN